MATRRIIKEFKDFTMDPVEGGLIDLADDRNIFEWRASIRGPPNSPYEGGTFHLKIVLPLDYPFKPPKVNFTTHVYHPNIGTTHGWVSLDVLGHQWSPALTVGRILLSLRALLDDPNPEDPLVPEIAKLYKVDRAKFLSNAREWTRRYAM